MLQIQARTQKSKESPLEARTLSHHLSNFVVKVTTEMKKKMNSRSSSYGEQIWQEDTRQNREGRQSKTVSCDAVFNLPLKSSKT